MNKLSSFASLLTALVLLLLIPASSLGQELMLGNGKVNTAAYEQGDKEGISGFSTRYVRQRMRAYKGNEISALVINFDSVTYNCQGRIFVSTDAAGQKVLAEQAFTVTHPEVWDTIRFETPYVVTGNEVYVGYELQHAAYLMASTRLIDGEDYCCLGGKAWRRYDDATKAPAMVTLLSGPTLPSADVKLTHLQSDRYGACQQASPCTLSLCNMTATPVHSLEVTYYEGNETQVENIEGLDIAPREVANVALCGPSLDNEGEHNLWLSITGINGSEDAAPYDNASNSWVLYCAPQLVERRVLMEVFSTERCTNCPIAHSNIDRLFGDDPQVIEVGHHAGFYTDQFSIDESVALEWFYTPTRGTYAPATMFDRTCGYQDQPRIYSDQVPIIDAQYASTMQPAYDLIRQTPAMASVEMDVHYDATQRQLTATISGQRLLPTDGETSLRLNVMAVEDSVFSQMQAGAYGEFYHRHVLRQCLTGTWGESIDLDHGYSRTYTLTLPTAWDANRMSLVAFVSNYDATDRCNCRVLNANEAHLSSLSDTSIKHVRQDDPSAIHQPAYNLFGHKQDSLIGGFRIANGKITFGSSK